MSVAKSKFLATILIIFALTLMLFLTSCGVKNNPIPPEKKIIPKITPLNYKILDNNVVLSWKPNFRYANGTEMELRSVEIFALEENLQERLLEYQQQADELAREQAEAGIESDSHDPLLAAADKSRKIIKMNRIPPQDFAGDATIVDSIPVEQMIDRSFGGEIYWSAPLQFSNSASNTIRKVFAVRERDMFGDYHSFSDFAILYPVGDLPAPENLSGSLLESKLVLIWSAPERSDDDMEFPLIGYNIYKATSEAEFDPKPLNKLPVKPLLFDGWSITNITSANKVKGIKNADGLLITTGKESAPPSLSQIIFRGSEIADHIGEEYDVSVTIKGYGELSEGRIILDSSVTPSSDEPDVGTDIFREEDNPLIHIENVEIGNEAKTYTFRTKVPVGAASYILNIQPNGINVIPGAYIVENVSISKVGEEENIVRNGDFSATIPLTYEEPIEKYGRTYKYKVSAVYSVENVLIERTSSDPVEIQLTDTFPPDPPRALRAQATFENISLTWSASRAADVKGYQVFRRIKGENRWRRMTKEALEVTIYQDDDVTEGKIYEYKVESVDTSGNLSSTTAIVESQLLSR